MGQRYTAAFGSAVLHLAYGRLHFDCIREAPPSRSKSAVFPLVALVSAISRHWWSEIGPGSENANGCGHDAHVPWQKQVEHRTPPYSWDERRVCVSSVDARSVLSPLHAYLAGGFRWCEDLIAWLAPTLVAIKQSAG